MAGMARDSWCIAGVPDVCRECACRSSTQARRPPIATVLGVPNALARAPEAGSRDSDPDAGREADALSPRLQGTLKLER